MMRRLFSSGCAMNLFTHRRQVASPALVFFSASLVMLMQAPVNLIIRAGWLSPGILLNEILIIAGVPLLFIFALGLDRRRMLPSARIDPALFAMIFLFIIGAVVLLDYATVVSEVFFPLPEEMREALDGVMKAETAGMIAWKLFLLCIVPGFCEEIFFRGFCQGSLAARWGNAWAIALTAAFFALMHGNIYHMHLYFLLGIVFGWVFYATGSIWTAVFCHVFNNSWTFINHVRGFKFPLGENTHGIDIAICIFAAILAVASAVMILRFRRRSAKGFGPADPRSKRFSG